jgi:hypothetical protein
MQRIRRQLNRKKVRDAPYERWNAFIDLLALENPNVLSDVQRIAQNAFRYDSEVQNGGHLQYFENEGVAHVEATMRALHTIGASAQARVLEGAAKRWSSVARESPKSIEEYSKVAFQGEFTDLDTQFYGCVPSIIEMLEHYLDQNELEFIEYEAG